jgi:hypothetical protein
MISIVFWAISAALIAGMDKLQFHFWRSKFAYLNHNFWNPEVSWKRKYSLPKWVPDSLSDGWHVLKTLAIIFLAVSALTAYNYGPPVILKNIHPVVNFLINMIVYGVVWNVVFNLFFNKILKRK